MGRQAPFAANHCHMLPILAHGSPPLAAGCRGLFRCELMGCAFLMRGLTSLTGNGPLLRFAHRRKSTGILHCMFCHNQPSFS
jgi:hypothetical protein